MKKVIERISTFMWFLFGKGEHVPCRWCASMVAPLCTDECQEACPMTKAYSGNQNRIDRLYIDEVSNNVL